MERLKGKTAMVVGAGSIGPGWGNGKATAVTFAREGAQVFCVDRNAAAAQETVDIITGEGGKATAFTADVSREVEVDVNEAYINRVKANQRVEATLDAYPDQTLAAHVINIVPTADRTKATVRVRIGFDKLESFILPDMGIKVRFLDEQPVAENASKGPRIRGRVATRSK